VMWHGTHTQTSTRPLSLAFKPPHPLQLTIITPFSAESIHEIHLLKVMARSKAEIHD